MLESRSGCFTRKFGVASKKASLTMNAERRRSNADGRGEALTAVYFERLCAPVCENPKQSAFDAFALASHETSRSRSFHLERVLSTQCDLELFPDRAQPIENVANIGVSRTRVHHRHPQHASPVEIGRGNPAFAGQIVALA